MKKTRTAEEITKLFFGDDYHKLTMNSVSPRLVIEAIETAQREILEAIIPTEIELHEKLDTLPYTKHVDDGQFNDGVLSGFEMGVEWMIQKILNIQPKK